eukprot:TRINITY_DN10433_c0_g1_i5.p1 TRINITY_DN10433_c0_g1~~TRINITY_DN10433_c0_g1_i5.p1  ORF type:complete len:954 (+),score=136.45 TRINITY_DN10433_c0_g1_i5:347-3208(+)
MHYSPTYPRTYVDGGGVPSCTATADGTDWDGACPCDSVVPTSILPVSDCAEDRDCTPLNDVYKGSTWRYCSSKHPEYCGCNKSAALPMGNPLNPDGVHCACTFKCCDYKLADTAFWSLYNNHTATAPFGQGENCGQPQKRIYGTQLGEVVKTGHKELTTPTIWTRCKDTVQDMIGVPTVYQDTSSRQKFISQISGYACDKYPFRWMSFPPKKIACDRFYGDHEYLHFELKYSSPGISPLLQLKIFAIPTSEFDGPINTQLLLPEQRPGFFEYILHPAVVPKTIAISVVPCLLAIMWMIGETFFLHKKLRTAQGEKYDQMCIAQERARDDSPFLLPQYAHPNAVLMTTRPAKSYPQLWKRSVTAWHEMCEVKRNIKTGKARALVLYLVYFGSGVFVTWFFLKVAPAPPDMDQQALDIRNWKFYANPLGDLAYYGVYDFVCFGALLLENLLFFWALLETEWPRASQSRDELELEVIQHKAKLQGRPEPKLKNTETEGLWTRTEDDVALLIACHKCDSTREKQAGLRIALLAALEIFPPSAIFICDNARETNPPDDTWKFIQRVLLDFRKEKGIVHDRQMLNYNYLPVGNKTLAFYWCVESWIPLLVKNKKCPDFKYIMMIDDDVCLPADIQFPLRNLEQEPDVVAYAYSISALDVKDPRYYEKHLDNAWIAYQNVEYLLAGFFKQFQSQYGTTLACHGAIALWRREILVNTILWRHDTMFNGEDLQMGLILHDLKKGYKIKSQPREIVQTEPPDHLGLLWQQRVKSWDVTQHRMTVRFLRILLFHWCGGISTLILKPFFLLEIFNICQDWARIFFFCYLLTYVDGIIHLFQWIIYLIILEWILLYGFSRSALKDRPDVRSPWQVYFKYPLVYKPMCQLFRWYALLENIVRYSPFTLKGMPVYEQEELGVLPPNLDGILKPDEVDWRTIWDREGMNEEPDDDMPMERQPSNSVVMV